MRTTIFLVLVTLVACLWAAPSAASAASAGTRVTMKAPKPVTGAAVRLTGTGPARAPVQIQRRTDGRRWVAVRTVRTNAKGRYTTTVAQTRTARRFRAVSRGAISPVRTVPALPQPSVTEEPNGPGDDCGPRLLKADGTAWTCTLADDFDGTTLDRTTWRPANGFFSGQGATRPCYIDDPSVISVRDGALHLSVRKLPAVAPCPGAKGDPTAYVGGGVDTWHLFSQQYGRFEARYKNTATNQVGLHEAFWLWPDDRYNTAIWPAAGEIDIAETYSQHPDLVVPFLHYTWYDNWGPVPGKNTAWNCAAKRGEYNTYTLEWEPRRLEIKVNGRTCLVNTSGDPAFQKPYIIALTQMLGVGDNLYDGRAPLPATMSVDYVRVWK